MRIALLQQNPLLGDLEGNAARLREGYREAVELGAGLVMGSELGITGYPPEDLLLKPAFVQANEQALAELAKTVEGVPLVIGFVEDLRTQERSAGRLVASAGAASPTLANAAAVLRDGRIEATYRKQRIPNYGVFDEARYFRPGTAPLIIEVDGVRVGVTVCEDLWGGGGPVQEAAAHGAKVVLSLNASPYHQGKRAERERWAAHHVAAGDIALAYCNLAAGQDEIVFDGDSFVMGADGSIGARGAQFATDVIVADLSESGTVTRVGSDDERLDPVAEVYAALVLGTRDYVRKNGFPGALVGVSGGIDSALVAAVAVDALGPQAVTGVAMPSPWSSQGSLDDARSLMGNLGGSYLELPIADVMKAFEHALAEPFAGTEPGTAEENIQARIRGTLLMALSNKHGAIVLATGNKSENAVGYATLYGDMAGGLAPIKDVPKMLVYELARDRNARADRALIPQPTIDKPPSAELRPGQVDTDALPPYELLDPILEAYVEQDRSVGEIARMGYPEEVVARIARMVDRAEHKRRQAAPGLKITGRAFGKDRRLPITQGWSG